ncbi:MAG: DUF2330 domain-containing protein [Planctomycetes bacterium]|nr:DUF2330 domain-containing protein [Planctomycetota bacterium]
MVRILTSICSLFVLCSLRLSADGKFFNNDKIPPNEPYQRAIIVHNNGEELLVIQPKIETKSKQFGWIVPVPGEARLGFIEPEKMGRLFWSFGLRSQPTVIYISTIFFFAVVIVLFLVLVFNTYIYTKYKKRPSRLINYFSVLLLLFCVLLLFNYTTIGGYLGVGGIEVIGEGQVGIYDAKVVKATNSDDLIKWLKTNGFNYTGEDKNSFDQYIKKNWVFVTLLSEPDKEAEKEFHCQTCLDSNRICIPSHNTKTKKGFPDFQGMVQPIALLFKTAEPVYPYALTGTYNKESELLLYVFSTKRVEFDRLKTDYACNGWSNKSLLEPIKWAGTETVNPMKFNNATFLTKLKGTISEFNEDILLKYHKNNDNYRSIVFGF